ncbi:MAG: hypothetical protein ACREUP_03390, partial [Burkholderiales bacterium]
PARMSGQAAAEVTYRGQNSKVQIPKPKQAPNSNDQMTDIVDSCRYLIWSIGVLDLEFVWDLVLGIWWLFVIWCLKLGACLTFGAWDLTLS